MTYVLWTYNDTGAILAVKATPTLECDLERLTLAWPIVTTEQFAAWEEESTYGGW